MGTNLSNEGKPRSSASSDDQDTSQADQAHSMLEAETAQRTNTWYRPTEVAYREYAKGEYASSVLASKPKGSEDDAESSSD